MISLIKIHREKDGSGTAVMLSPDCHITDRGYMTPPIVEDVHAIRAYERGVWAGARFVNQMVRNRMTDRETTLARPTGKSFPLGVRQGFQAVREELAEKMEALRLWVGVTQRKFKRSEVGGHNQSPGCVNTGTDHTCHKFDEMPEEVEVNLILQGGRFYFIVIMFFAFLTVTTLF